MGQIISLTIEIFIVNSYIILFYKINPKYILIKIYILKL
jgi:hypothetical protein